jgi:hypothetical protein
MKKMHPEGLPGETAGDVLTCRSLDLSQGKPQIFIFNTALSRISTHDPIKRGYAIYLF